MQLSLEVKNKNGEVLASKSGENYAILVYESEYAEGDTLVLKSSEKDVYLMLKLEDSMNEEFVYLTKDELTYLIPFGEKRISYSPKTFIGKNHVLTVRTATQAEISANKNLARNCYDQHGDTGCYPHVHANVETRGEAMFAAKNAINGNRCNTSHGGWPYESWGINMQDDAEITIEFGREVEIDSMVLVTRADFPHDNYWKQVTFTFSDGTTLVYDMEKSYDPHYVKLTEKKKVSWIKLEKLIKDPDDPSPFPALSQWEVYGTDIK
ncbi:MAG: carbohydrate-binding protein [Clostridia bacterium]|nr:carbohydrate-binding protein [Clostridia bacterium]